MIVESSSCEEDHNEQPATMSEYTQILQMIKQLSDKQDSNHSEVVLRISELTGSKLAEFERRTATVEAELDAIKAHNPLLSKPVVSTDKDSNDDIVKAGGSVHVQQDTMALEQRIAALELEVKAMKAQAELQRQELAGSDRESSDSAFDCLQSDDKGKASGCKQPVSFDDAIMIKAPREMRVIVDGINPAADLLMQQYNLQDEVAMKLVDWGLQDVGDFNFVDADMVKSLGLKPIREAALNRLIESVKTQTELRYARINAALRLDAAAKTAVAEELLAACKAQGAPTAATISVLLDRGADINCADAKGKAAVTWAAENGHTEALKLLLASGASYGRSKLPSWAAVRVAPTTKELLQQFSVRADVALKLVELGVSEVSDLDLVDEAELKALTLKRLEEAPLNRLVQAVKAQAAQRAARADVRAKLDDEAKQKLADALLDACKPDTAPATKSISDLLDQGADIDCADDDGRAPLAYAAGNGHVEVVKLLLADGAKVDKVNKDGWTALHFAAHAGRTEALYQLLIHGAVVDKLANDGSTPLSWAAGKAQLTCTELLYQWGGNVNAPNKAGNTALMGAAYWGHEDCLRFLLKHGAKVDMVAVGGKTALAYAEDQNKAACVEMLKRHMAATAASA